jgi:hypothetical protein
MLLTESGKVSVPVKRVYAKASLPMVVTEFGIDSPPVSVVQLLKALIPMFVTPLLRVSPVKVENRKA